MLTGDNSAPPSHRPQAGVDQVIAGVLPDGKEARDPPLRSAGRWPWWATASTTLRRSPARTSALPLAPGTDVAIDAADVVLMKSRLSDVPAAIRLSRATLRNIHENLFWAFFYNIIGIPWRRVCSSPAALDAEPHVRRCGHEPVQLLRGFQRPAAEPVRYSQHQT